MATMVIEYEPLLSKLALRPAVARSIISLQSGQYTGIGDTEGSLVSTLQAVGYGVIGCVLVRRHVGKRIPQYQHPGQH